MADRNKFEEMLEKLVAEDRKGAEELFHEIVVEKSRNIYENLLADDVKELDVEEAKKEDEEVDEASKEDDKEVDEASKEDSEDKVDEASKEEKDEETTEATDEEKTEEGIEEITPEAPAPEMGGDPADDMIDDVEDAMDGDKDDEDKGEDDEDIEDRVVDLEDALDDLKSEFEKMMGDKEEKGDDEEDSEAPMDDMGDEEKEDEALAPTSELGVEEMPVESKDETAKSNTEQMREYVEKVAEPKGEDNKAKSPVAGKNDMGGTASNIAKGSAEEKGGSAMAPKEDNMGNVNVPGGKASKSMKADSKGHGAEKKGSGETGTDSKSIIGS